MTGVLLFVLFVGGLIAFVRLADATRRLELLEANVRYLRNELEWFRRKLKELRRGSETESEAAGADGEEPVVAPPLTAEAPVPVAPEVEPRFAPAAETAFTAPAPEATVDQQPAAAFTATESATHPEIAAAASALPPAPPPSTPPQGEPALRPTPPSRPFDWESLVGVKLFSWIAGIALVLAALFFLRYSVEQGWFSPTVRATIGLLSGVILLVVCEMRVARNYSWTANALHGAGIAILYSTLFAMHAMWHVAPAAWCSS